MMFVTPTHCHLGNHLQSNNGEATKQQPLIRQRNMTRCQQLWYRNKGRTVAAPVQIQRSNSSSDKLAWYPDVGRPTGTISSWKGTNGGGVAQPRGLRPSLLKIEGTEAPDWQATAQLQSRVLRFDGQAIEGQLKVFFMQLNN